MKTNTNTETENETDVTGRGDELKPAENLKDAAEVLEAQNLHSIANQAKKKARKIVGKELNELDGFPNSNPPQ